VNYYHILIYLVKIGFECFDDESILLCSFFFFFLGVWFKIDLMSVHFLNV
jgi:hypothetical protein